MGLRLNSFQTELTHPIRRMPPPQSAQHPHAMNPLDSSSVATTAGSVAASSVGSTRPSWSDSTSLPGSIPTVRCIVRATAATIPSASGSTFAPVAPTARIPVAALPRSRRLPPPCQQSDQRTSVSAASHRVSKVPGTGALFEARPLQYWSAATIALLLDQCSLPSPNIPLLIHPWASYSRLFLHQHTCITSAHQFHGRSSVSDAIQRFFRLCMAHT
jgi:hypothetical protein